MDTLWQDIRYSFRTLVKNPGFAAVAVLTLALGLGANTAIFSLTDQILLRRLPVERPDELTVLRSPGPKSGHTWSDGDGAASFSYPLYAALRDKNSVFSGLLARFAVPLSVSSEGQTERANGELVSGNYFAVLGVRPAMGRVFTEDDDRTPGASPIVVLSHGYWSRRFGGDAGVLNKPVNINGVPMTVVGVAGAGFNGVQVGQMPDVFIPMTMKDQMTPDWKNALNDPKDYWLAMIGRMKPGLSRQQGEAAIATVYRQILEEQLPQQGKLSPEQQERFVGKPLLLDEGSRGRPILQRDAKAPLLVLMGMVGLVLLIACANVANLLMARGAARQREVAIRMAVGAGRFRLLRQFLVESLLLSLIGGVVGLLVAAWTISGLFSVIPDGFGAAGLSPQLDARLLIFTFVLALVTGLVFGLAPALRATRLNLESTLREQGSSVSGSRAQVRFRKGLVVSQIVLTTVLLVGAGLFARSLNNLNKLDLGLRPDQLIEFSVEPQLNGYSPQRTVTFFDDLHQRLAALPGVEAVSEAEIPPFTDSSAGSNITVEGFQAQDDDDMHVNRNTVGANFFSTMGIPLIKGREFTHADGPDAPKVAVVNETFARRYFDGREPLGSHFGFGGGNNVKLDLQIVGVVKDSKAASVREPEKPFVYLPYTQRAPFGSYTFYVRTQQDAGAIAQTLRTEVQRLDADLPIFNLKTVQQQINESLFLDRFLTMLSLSYALLAALLAVVGLYGVMAYTVTRRTREIGIRMALGATRGNVSWLILREVVMLALISLIIGLPVAYVLGRLGESLLFGVKAGDPLVFIAAGLLLSAATFVGGYLPARKAASIDPLTALRYE